MRQQHPIDSEEELGENSGSIKDLGPFQRAAEWNGATAGAQLTRPWKHESVVDHKLLLSEVGLTGRLHARSAPRCSCCQDQAQAGVALTAPLHPALV